MEGRSCAAHRPRSYRARGAPLTLRPERLLARLLQGVGVIWAAATLAFVCLHLAPGDPATALGEGIPAEVRNRLRALYGFDAPIATQYLRWFGALLQGELGFSRAQQRPVTAILAEAIPNTLMLMLPAFVLSFAGGIAIGRWQAAHAGSRRDRVISRTLLVLFSIPEFWLALGLVLLVSGMLGLLPPSGITSDIYAYLPPAAQWRDRVEHLVLPLTTTTLIGLASIARYQRQTLASTLDQPFVRTAMASGLPRSRVLRGAWRASLLPVITIAGLLLPAYFAGVVFVEQVFAWPGMGRLMVQAIGARDYAVVTAGVLVGSAITTLGALVADLLREAADPRLRTEGAAPAGGPAA